MKQEKTPLCLATPKLSLVLASGTVFCAVLSTNILPAQARTPWRQPFHSDAIWNTPIGNSASYSAPVGLGKSDEFAAPDVEYHYRGLNKDPEVSTGSYAGNIRFPYYAIPNMSHGSAPNNCTSYVQPDGNTLWQWQYFSRSGFGANLNLSTMQVGTANQWGDIQLTDTWSEAEWGTHGGSMMSTLGGSIRRGELTGGANPSNVNNGDGDSIRHAMKLNVDGARYLYNGTPNGDGRKGSGWRWPAFTADSCAPGCYGGNNPDFAIGSLLAIPASTDLNTLNLETKAGKKVAWTAKNFGFYIVDSSGWTANEISVEKGVSQELQAHYGAVSGNAFPASFGRDMMKIFARLAVVTNNSPSAFGGPGSRLTGRPASLGGINTIADGIYKIKSKANGLYWDVPYASTNNGVKIGLYTGNSNTNQRFQFRHYGNGYYTIKAVHSGKGVDISGVSLNDGATVQQYDLPNPPSDNQLFSVIPLEGAFIIEARHSDKAIQIPNSDSPELRQYTTAGGKNNQLWHLEYVSAPLSSMRVQSTSPSGQGF
mgnify:CR=1 FL=1